MPVFSELVGEGNDKDFHIALKIQTCIARLMRNFHLRRMIAGCKDLTLVIREGEMMYTFQLYNFDSLLYCSDSFHSFLMYSYWYSVILCLLSYGCHVSAKS